MSHLVLLNETTEKQGHNLFCFKLYIINVTCFVWYFTICIWIGSLIADFLFAIYFILLLSLLHRSHVYILFFKFFCLFVCFISLAASVLLKNCNINSDKVKFCIFLIKCTLKSEWSEIIYGINCTSLMF